MKMHKLLKKPNGKLAVICTMLMIGITVLGFIFYMDEDVCVEWYLNSLRENMEINEEYSTPQLRRMIKNSIFSCYCLVPLICAISQIVSIWILTQNERNKDGRLKLGKMVCWSVFMGISTIFCLYATLKLIAGFSESIYSTMLLITQLIPGVVALGTNTGHIYIYYSLMTKITSKNIDATIKMAKAEYDPKNNLENQRSEVQYNTQASMSPPVAGGQMASTPRQGKHRNQEGGW